MAAGACAYRCTVSSEFQFSEAGAIRAHRAAAPFDGLRALLRIALGSANETDYWVLLAHDLGYLDHDTANDIERSLTTIRRMLARLIQSLNRSTNQPPTANSQ